MRLTAAEPQLRSVDAALAGGGLVAAGSAALNWGTGLRCPLYTLTGHWCAFCGATRAVVALVKRHPEAALRDNSLVVLILILVGVRYALRLAGARSFVASVDGLLERVDLRVWAALLLVWTAVRNVPYLWWLGPPN